MWWIKSQFLRTDSMNAGITWTSHQSFFAALAKLFFLNSIVNLKRWIEDETCWKIKEKVWLLMQLNQFFIFGVEFKLILVFIESFFKWNKTFVRKFIFHLMTHLIWPAAAAFVKFTHVLLISFQNRLTLVKTAFIVVNKNFIKLNCLN